MTETPTYPAQARRLERSRSNRKIAGVAGGLAQYFDLDPVIYRVGFIILTLLGGSGLLLYAAAWLILPDEGKDESIAAEVLRERRDRPWALIGLGLLGVAGLVLLGRADLSPGGDGIWVGLAVLGGILLWNQRRADGRPHRGVRIVLGTLLALIVAALAAVAVAVASFGNIGDGIGHREYRVSSPINIHHSYKLGIGDLKLDLSDAQLPRGATPVTLRVGIGNLRVTVPSDAIIQYKAGVDAGDVSVLGADRSGRNVDSIGSLNPTSTADAPVLVLDTHVGVGRIEIDRAVR
jgi:phage shock protein PspC (stress-responsive transcriptional regulator)